MKCKNSIQHMICLKSQVSKIVILISRSLRDFLQYISYNERLSVIYKKQHWEGILSDFVVLSDRLSITIYRALNA